MTTTFHDEHRVEPGANTITRGHAVIEFERAIAEFSRVILAGDAEYVRTMTAFVESMIGDES